ncbi:monovalent cation/H+ antiporter subunit D family protein [Dehalococcoidia bacterium]|nr:monovalent cation/H+ antiporter subunit D family protein [Dehalococcoidia bacterium]
MDDSIILVVMTPFVGAYLSPLLGLWRERLCHLVAVAAALLSLFFSFRLAGSVLTSGTIRYWVGGWEPPWGIELVVDPLSAFMCLTISLVSLLAVIYSKNFIEKELPGGKMTSYYTLILLLIGGMLGVVVTGDLFNLFVLTEIFSVAAYALVAISGKRGSFIGSYRYLILASIGTSLILLGTGYLYIITGTLNMADLSVRLPAFYDSWVVFGALAFLLIGFGIKTALFPLHTWLPGAYSIAPAPVTVIFSAAVSKVGGYSLIRVLFTIFGLEFITDLVPVAPALTWVAAATILVASMFAISQTSLMRMLAYSSVAHIGYVVLGVALAVEMGMTGGILHIFNHALATGCLFFCAGAVIYKTGIRRIDDLRGLGGKMPLTMAAFTLAAVSKVGIPPSAGFVSKFYLSLGALEAGEWIFVIVILLASLMTAVFYLRVINLIFFGGDKHEGKVQRDELPLSMLVPIIILALGCAVFGIFVGIPLRLVEPAVMVLSGM